MRFSDTEEEMIKLLNSQLPRFALPRIASDVLMTASGYKQQPDLQSLYISDI